MLCVRPATTEPACPTRLVSCTFQKLKVFLKYDPVYEPRNLYAAAGAGAGAGWGGVRPQAGPPDGYGPITDRSRTDHGPITDRSRTRHDEELEFRSRRRGEPESPRSRYGHGAARPWSDLN